jgi:hypothetical protein
VRQRHRGSWDTEPGYRGQLRAVAKSVLHKRQGLVCTGCGAPRAGSLCGQSIRTIFRRNQSDRRSTSTYVLGSKRPGEVCFSRVCAERILGQRFRHKFVKKPAILADNLAPFDSKSTGGSNPLLSATQSVDLAYNLEKAERSRGRRGSLRRQRTGEGGLMPDSRASAGILSARNKNGSLRRSGQDFRLGIAALRRPGISIGQTVKRVQLEVFIRYRGHRVAPAIPAAGRCG